MKIAMFEGLKRHRKHHRKHKRHHHKHRKHMRGMSKSERKANFKAAAKYCMTGKAPIKSKGRCMKIALTEGLAAAKAKYKK